MLSRLARTRTGDRTRDVNGDECTCGNLGCVENYAGPSAVVRQALATPGLTQRLSLAPAAHDVLTEFSRIAVAGNTYQSVIQHEIDRRTFARQAHPVRVVPSISGSEAAAIGGAVLVLQSRLTHGHPRLTPPPGGISR